MSATTQNRSSKQPQLKLKAAEPAKPRVMQPTTEQLRMAELLQKGGASLSDAEIAEKVATLCDAAQCSEDDALLALCDADNDSNRALNLLLERMEAPDNEWHHATAKKNKKVVGQQPNGDREGHVVERNQSDGPANAKRTRAARGRQVTQNGDGDQHRENGRAGRGRPRGPRPAAAEGDSHAADGASHSRAEADDSLQQSANARNTTNGFEGNGDTQTEDHGWQPARQRGDSKSKRGRSEAGPKTDSEQTDRGAPARRGEARSVNRLGGRGGAQRGGGAARGRSAGPHNEWRTYSRTAANEQDGDGEGEGEGEAEEQADGLTSETQAEAAAPTHPGKQVKVKTEGAQAWRGRTANSNQTNNHVKAGQGAANDEWANDEWEGGAGSWQNTDKRSGKTAEPSVPSFASIVAQRANAAAQANQAASTASSNSKQPQTQTQTHTTITSSEKPAAAAAAAAAASPAPSAALPNTSNHHNAVVSPQQKQQQQQQQQQRTEEPAPLGQRPAVNAQHLTQKIDLADLLKSNTQPAPASVPAQAAPAATAAQRLNNAPFNAVPTGLGQQSAALPGLNQQTFTQTALPATSLAVGSQTQGGVGRALNPSVAAANQAVRSLPDEAVVMPFKVSEAVSSAFQFGFSTDYVNPNPASHEVATGRAQPQPVGFTQPQPQAASNAGAFVDSDIAKQQPSAAQLSRTFGAVAQTPFAVATSTGAQQQSQSGIQVQPASAATVTAGLNRMTIDNDSGSGSAMKATANAFVPAHLGGMSQQNHTETNSSQQRDTAQFFGYAVNQQQSGSLASTTQQQQQQQQQQHLAAAANANNQQQPTTNVSQSQSHAAEATSVNAGHSHSHSQSSTHHHSAAPTSGAAASTQVKSSLDTSRQLGASVGLNTSAEDNTGNYVQQPRGQAPNSAAPASQAHQQQQQQQQLQHMFTQLQHMFSQSQAQPPAAGQAGPNAPGGLSSTGTAGFNAPPGAPGQTQPYNLPYAVYPSYHFAQAQQLFNLLQHAPPQSAAAQQPFAAVSQPQSAASSGTPTQSSGAPFGTATQFGIGLHSAMVGGANATQSGASAAQSSAQQASAATAKLLAAASGGGFASQSYATGGEDSNNAFGTSSMFVGAEYQRQAGVVPNYQQKAANDYPAFKAQAHVGVVGTPMLEKGAGNYYNTASGNAVPPSSNPPPGLGSVAVGQSSVSAINAANFGMYAPSNPAPHHPYMMTNTHPGMFVPGSMVSAAGAIGAQKAATPTKPPGFQNANWQPPY